MNPRKKILLLVSLFIFAVFCGAAYYLLFTSSGLTFAAAFFANTLPADEISAASVRGSLFSGAVFRDIEVSGIKALPGGVIRIQELKMVVRPFKHVDMVLKNGRLELPSGELISFRGTVDSGKVSANVYSGLLYLQTLSKFPGFRFPPHLNGKISGLDLRISDTVNFPLIEGTLVLENAYFRNFSALNFPVKVEMKVTGSEKSRELKGILTCSDGRLVSPYVSMEIQEGLFVFPGGPAGPRFKLRGKTVVAGTKVNAVFSGSSGKPELQLSSQPPLPQERLMFMLLTGRDWQGTENALAQGRITPGLLKDFADFFLFGGSVESLERRLGITDLAITYDRNTRGIEVHKSITPSAGVIYGLSEEGSAEKKQQTQTLGVEYKLTDSFSLEGKKKKTEDVSGTRVGPGESVVRLKFRKNF